MTAYALLSIKVAHADREYRRLRLEAQHLYEKSDAITEEWLYGSDADCEMAAEFSNAANLVDIAAGQHYDVANCMWPGRDDDEQESDAADWLATTQELRHG